MGKRRDPRIQARLEVRIAGIDVHGRPLLQAATTGNISRRGALLQGMQGTLKPGEVISVTYKKNKARFRVAWVILRDISVGGCFVDMPTLPPESGGLKMVVWVNEAKLTLQGVIVSRRAGFGISIRFTEMTKEVREHLERFIQPHSMMLKS